MSQAVFVPEGPLLVPQPLSRAGWYADALHGGPVAAAFARAFEQVAAPVPMQVTRITVDIMRPVPTKPLSIETRLARAGKRIQVLHARMEADGLEVALASALRLRVADVPVPDHPRRSFPTDPLACDVTHLGSREEPWFHTAAVEIRYVEGGFFEPGPGTAWARLLVPLVEGEEPTPLQLVATTADFGNGVSQFLPREYVFINADLSIYLHRLPVDGWIGLRSRSDVDDVGVGLAQSELFDRLGALGHSVQSLYVDHARDLK